MEIFKKFFNVDENGTFDHEIDVEMDENGDTTSQEEDVGQIALDVFEVLEGIIIVAPLAGVHASDIDVTLVKNVVTISGMRKQPEIYSESVRSYVEECFYGPFSRSIIMPDHLSLSEIRAVIEKGLLIVTIPKMQVESQSVKIEQLEDIV